MEFTGLETAASRLDLTLGLVEYENVVKGNFVYNSALFKAKTIEENGEIIERVEVFSLEGRLVKSITLESDTGNMFLSGLHNGLYLVKAFMKNGQEGNAKFQLFKP